MGASRRTHADIFVSPEPAEHPDGQADASHVSSHLPARPPALERRMISDWAGEQRGRGAGQKRFPSAPLPPGPSAPRPGSGYALDLGTGLLAESRLHKTPLRGGNLMKTFPTLPL